MTKNIYTIITFLAIGAIIFFGVDTFFQIFRAQLEQPELETTSEIKKPPRDVKPSRSKLRLSDYDIIDRRSIFGKTAEGVSGSVEDIIPEDLPTVSLNVTLNGTIEGDQESAAAIITDKSERPAQQGLYYIGDSVAGNALIKKIAMRKVVLRVNGEDQILTMDEEESKPGSTLTPPPVRQSVPRPTSSTVTTRTIQIQRDDVEEATSDLQKLMTQAKIQPHFTDGEPDGLAITQVKTGSIFRKMGLRSGDIVKSVQGNDIKSPEDLMELYNDYQSEDKLSLQIIRRGREYNIDLRLR